MAQKGLALHAVLLGSSQGTCETERFGDNRAFRCLGYLSDTVRFGDVYLDPTNDNCMTVSRGVCLRCKNSVCDASSRFFLDGTAHTHTNLSVPSLQLTSCRLFNGLLKMEFVLA